MSELIVAGFKGEFTADEVLLDLLKMEQTHLIDLEDAAIAVRKEDGTIKIKQSNVLVTADAAAGTEWGLVFGTLLLSPLIGTLVGGVVGAAIGETVKIMKKIGVKEDFIKDVADTLEPNSSAIFILIRKSLPDKVTEELRKFKAKLLRTTLSTKNETELRKALEESVTLKEMGPKSSS